MLISTVIPTVARSVLSRAVESALDQGLGAEAHEIVVVNDSGAALAEAPWMKAPQVRVIDTHRRQRCVARNAGAALARGRYLHFLDDDDFLLPGGLRALLDVAQSSGAAWIYGALQRVDDDARPLSVDRPVIRGNVLVALMAGETWHLGSSLVLADEFFRAGGFHPELIVGQDRDLELRIALLHDFERCDQVIVCVRVGAQGATTTAWRQLPENSRRMREWALERRGTVARLLDSVGSNPYLRGRAVRAYALSLLLRAARGNVDTAVRRFGAILRLAAWYPLRRAFWAGLRQGPGLERPCPPDATVRGARLRNAGG